MTCGYCYNPLEWKPQPPESAECYCTMDHDNVTLTEDETPTSETEWTSESSDESLPTRRASPLPVDNPNDDSKQWTIYTPAYTYDQPMLDRQYADYMVQVNTTDSQHEETFHLCFLCNRHLPVDRYVHNCTYGYGLGQQHTEMRPEYLVNTPWWEVRSPTSESDSSDASYPCFNSWNEDNSGRNSPDLYTSIPYNGPTKWTTDDQCNTYLTDDDDYYTAPNSPDSSPSYIPNSPGPQKWFNDDDWAEYNFHKYINY